MIRKFAIIVFCLTFVLAFLFSSCKKGEQDPGLSLRSRKARITERWSMVKGSVGLTSQEPNQAPYNANFEFNGGDGFLTQSSTLVIYTMPYVLNIEFKKDGKFSVTENFNGKTMTCSGKWNFSGRVGDTKNKEEVFIQLETISSGDTQDHLFNHYGTELSYTIDRLSKDEIIIHASTKYYMNSAGQKGFIESQYTFKKH